MATPKEILVEARRLLVEVGWCQSTWAKSGKGSVAIMNPQADAYCAVGALVCATHKFSGGDADYNRARFALHDNAYEVTKDGGHFSIMEFNDAKDRKKEEVIALFDHVIAKLSESTETP